MRVARRVQVEESQAEREASRQRLARLRARMELLDERRDEWLRLYPDQWLAIGEHGIECVAPSQEELMRHVDVQRARDGDIIVEFLAVDPPRLLL